MSNNVVDILRDKTDEADLDQILKTQMGGYTKKSVQDYLSRIKRQQQQTAEAFNRDMQAMLDEKEQLKAENTQLKNRLTKVVTDYKMLSDHVASVKAGETNVTMDDVFQLRGHVRVLEKDKQDALAKIKQTERTVEQKQHIIGEKNRLIDQLKQESIMYQEMLSGERSDKEKLQKTVTEQSTEIDQLQGEIHFLKSILTDSGESLHLVGRNISANTHNGISIKPSIRQSAQRIHRTWTRCREVNTNFSACSGISVCCQSAALFMITDMGRNLVFALI